MIRTYEERERLIKEYQESGSPPKSWSESKGIAYSTFRGWLRQSEQQSNTEMPAVKPQQTEQPVSWAALTATPVNLPEPAISQRQGQISLTRESWTISIENSFDAELLAKVMKVVNRVCC